MSLIDRAYSGDYPHLRFTGAARARNSAATNQLADRLTAKYGGFYCHRCCATDAVPARPIKMMPKPKMRRVRVLVSQGRNLERWHWFWRATIPGMGAQHRDADGAYRMLVRKWKEAP